MHQLYSSRSGNPDLDPQKNVDFEAGYKYSFSNVPTAVFVNFFYNRVRDLIDRISRYDPYENLADASIYGFETGASVTPHPWFTLAGDYTFTSTEDVSDEPMFDELPYTPKHMLNLSGTFTAPFGLSVSAIGQISGKRYEYDRDNNKIEVPGFEFMNLKIEQALYRDISVFLYVQNLFDANYYEEVGFEQSGRAFWGGLSLFLD
jgi:outer membrane receptor for ferrienterochelin and colicins